MNTYSFVSVEPSGKKKSGFVEAPNKEAAMQSITASGNYVLSIQEEAQAKKGPATGLTHRRASRSDVALFTRRLADLASAGLPLDRALEVAAEQSENAQLAGAAYEALEDVRGGAPISEALSKFPRLFNTVFVQTLRAGEASGQFPEVAGRLAEFQEMEVQRRSKIVSAMVYPAILAFTAVAVVIFMLTFVVPRLSGVFDDLGSDLPATTKILLSTTDFITANGLYILAGIVVAVLGYRAWAATDAGALAKDKFLLKLPIAGKIVSKATVSRYARVMGTLVYGGVPILDAIKLSGLASGNKVLEHSNETVEEEVREGRRIADAMRDTGQFPSVLTHMVAIGEETGDLPKMLTRVSDSLDFEVDQGMQRLTALVEPIIVVAMGTFVGFVVLSILLPIYQAQDLIK